MARKNIELGVIPSGQGGDTFRSAMIKVNDMTEELYEKTAGTRTVVTSGSLNTMIAPGKYMIIGAGGVALEGSPESDGVPRVNGYLDVDTSHDPVDGMIRILQRWNAPGSSQMWTRWRISGGSGWSEWVISVFVGDYGLGTSKGNLISDYNAINKGGLYCTNTTTANGPDVGFRTVLHAPGIDSSSYTQFAVGQGANAMAWLRGTIGGVPGPWKAILKAGDYGIGAVDGAPIANDCNTAKTSGKYIVPQGTLNSPINAYGTLDVSVYNNSSATQIYTALDVNGPQLYFRSQAAGVWLPWTRVGTETITNANGTATKFPDGTMICSLVNKDSGVTALYEGAFYVSPAVPFVFPVAFVGAIPQVAVTVSSPVQKLCWGVSSGAHSLTAPSNARVISVAAGASASIGMIAVGRWK